MSRLTYVEGVIDALAESMREDPDVFLMGQDIGPFGGTMQSTKGLWEEFGYDRVIDTPISEAGAVGAAIGAALQGLKPVIEISFGEFLASTMAELVCQAPGVYYYTGQRATLPLVVRTKIGDGPYRGHPQCYESWFAHIPGLKVVMPAFPDDCKGLMVAAIREPNPVLFIEDMYLYHAIRGEVASGLWETPIGQAKVVRTGTHATVIATGWMLHKALTAARNLAREGVELEVIDPRTLAPLDMPAFLMSVKKTGHVVIAHEAWKTGGIGAEIAAGIAEDGFGDLKAPIARVGAPHTPIPIPKPLRDTYIPDVPDIESAVRKVLAWN
ncbi:MAG TPA: transketolase C-terminal domain-containing protein [Chloroflexota bacterium]|nr:transketolase C-terminal domain-containing protein [Chloroflexota bacterium]